ncbi:TonB-linked SusC/RagA family outer membrane protein [Marinilabilia salmonicolor]|nr:TonB-linked SusC/RagA family outer membrane protein [Marinilabilia salmonicolor]
MFFFMAGIGLMMAQQTVTGVVTDSSNEPIPGVSILEKGTMNGTITQVDGNYSIEVSDDATLVFSFIGFESQEVPVEGRSVINVVLTENITDLDEVVVVGYGVQKKKLVTGATLQVKGEDIERMNNTSPLQALQGRTPGVNISSTSGQPGADMKVTIRGLGTIGNAGPLYIIDGIEGDISTIAPSDIESIDVLKDAASAAIYGSQAANGVVLVTTKTGKAGKAQVTFDTYYGIQQVARYTDMLNRNEYINIMQEQAANSGAALYNPSIFDGTADTDWVEQMFVDDAVTQNYNIGLSGGSESSIYSMSLNYTGQEGVVGGSDVSNYERYGFRLNTEHKLYNDILKVGQHLNFSYIMKNGVQVGNQYSNTLRGAFGTSPLAPVFSDNNKYDSPYNDTSSSQWYDGDGNPYGHMMTNSNNENDDQRLLADVYAELEPIENLTLKTVFGINYYAGEYRSYTPLYRFSVYSYNEDHTTVQQNMSKGHTLTWTNTASYNFEVGDHRFEVLGGMESIQYQGMRVQGSNWDLLEQFDSWDYAYLDNTTGQATLVEDEDGNITGVTEKRNVEGGPEVKARRVSYFARFGYNFKEKYMLNATFRADGSSKFQESNRWGYFPSVSAGWVMSEESFLEDAGNWMNYLKLRASWGQVGNQNIENFQYASPMIITNYDGDYPAGYYLFGTQLGSNVKGAYPGRLANAGVKWETSEQINVGIDARFLHSRLGANIDYYIKTTKDWLVEAPILGTAGTGAPFINGGDVKNTGIELALNWNDQIGDLRYSLSANGAYNKNEVGAIPTEDGIIHGESNMLYDNSGEFYRAQNGHAIGYFWGFETTGIFQNEAEIQSWRDAGNGIFQPNVKPGDVKYVDQNKDGKINEDDKVDLGNGMPDFTFGFNVNLMYKNFDFNVTASGVAGNKIVQSYRNHANKKANYTSAILARWTGEGTSNKMPRVTDNNVNWSFSDLYLQDGDFLRISNISLGYDFSELINWEYLGQLRFYGQVQNAFTFTKYDGMDPEVGYGTSDWVSGVDLGYYPRPRVFLLGVNVKF